MPGCSCIAANAFDSLESAIAASRPRLSADCAHGHHEQAVSELVHDDLMPKSSAPRGLHQDVGEVAKSSAAVGRAHHEAGRQRCQHGIALAAHEVEFAAQHRSETRLARAFLCARRLRAQYVRAAHRKHHEVATRQVRRRLQGSAHDPAFAFAEQVELSAVGLRLLFVPAAAVACVFEDADTHLMRGQHRLQHCFP
ncbi:MAG TPA: hypothetical protein VM240_03955 [Verrucomicrobiae bacterium]|nr:hypothetical protein [Verrucomicrobiae bacterium]